MNSKERVRRALSRQETDRVPANFEAVYTVTQRLLKHYGFKNIQQLYDKFSIDYANAGAKYIGPELKNYVNAEGNPVKQSFWGFENTTHTTKLATYGVTTYFPLDDVETIEEVEAYKWPDPDWFDYSSITAAVENNPDKAIVFGHEGPFQIVTNLMSMENFFILMIEEPDVAQRILDKMCEFELAFYTRCFEAGKGKLDVLRTHDDYGTQQSLLFSMDMWTKFFEKNTRKLVDLAHSYGAFFQQHSCGAVEPIIPKLIECGVDSLEPIQKVVGMDADELVKKYGGKISFHGGVDTQGILPRGTKQEVLQETERLIQTFGKTNGYILMASQGFEDDVPIENIEAVYEADRVVK